MGRIHLQVALEMGWHCVAAIDPSPNPESQRILPDGVPVYTGMHRELFDLEPDAVILSTTTDVRANLLPVFLKHSSVKLIVSEKPLTNSIARAREALDLASNNHKQVVVNHQTRFTPHYKFVSECIDDMRFGELEGVTVAGVNFGLGNNAVHFIELACFLFGSTPRNVFAELEEQLIDNPRGESFKDHSGRLELHFESNKVASMDFRNSLGHGLLSLLSFRHGKLVVNELDGSVTAYSRDPVDFEKPTSNYALAGRTESWDFGAIDIKGATEDLYRSLSSDANSGSLLRAVAAVEVASFAIHSGNNSWAVEDSTLWNSRLRWANEVAPWA